MKRTKKILTAVTIIALLATVGMVSPVMAQTSYQYITTADNADFTIVKQGLAGTEQITVVGLDYSQTNPKVPFTTEEEEYITWTSSNPSRVILFDPATLQIGATVTGTDTVTVITVLRGDAVVTATYDTPDDPATSVTSYVATEGLQQVSSVSGVDITYNGDQTTDFTINDITVPLFDAGAALDLADSSDILKQSPSALHALLYALEIQNSSETTSTPIGSFDWDWVRANVVMGDDSQGSYVAAIGDDEEYSDPVNLRLLRMAVPCQ